MRVPSDWVGYWNDAPPIYSGPRHKSVHYDAIASDIVRHIGGTHWTVLDFGCGDALSAERVAANCGRLILVDGAETVRTGLCERTGHLNNVRVAAPEELETAVDAASVDLIVINSVVQYLTADELTGLIERLLPLLQPMGRIIVADVVPPDSSPVHDAAALMTFAARQGFLIPAGIGLVRTFASNYRHVRDKLGFSQYSEADFVALMARAGFDCARIRPNFGHNQRRMAFLATPQPTPT